MSSGVTTLNLTSKLFLPQPFTAPHHMLAAPAKCRLLINLRNPRGHYWRKRKRLERKRELFLQQDTTSVNFHHIKTNIAHQKNRFSGNIGRWLKASSILQIKSIVNVFSKLNTTLGFD